MAACGAGRVVAAIISPVYGNAAKRCNSTASWRVLADKCLGEQSCSVSAWDGTFGGDPCRGVDKSLSFWYRRALGEGQRDWGLGQRTG